MLLTAIRRMIARYMPVLANYLTFPRTVLLVAHLLLIYKIFFHTSGNKMSTFVELSNGQKMPAIGLGTWQATEEKEVENAVEEALKAGYRLIDTAFLYTNEEAIGKVLERWLSAGKLKRDELFIVTKLPGIGMTPEKVSHFLQLSLKALKLEYVDLYLVHSPIGYQYINDSDIQPMRDNEPLLDNSTDLLAVWKAMESQVDAGLTKSIGVSNYNIEQLERTIQAARIPPVVIQVEVHAYFQQKPLQEICNKHKVILCGYAPLGSPGRTVLFAKKGLKFNDIGLLDDPVVNTIAKKLEKTASQILLRFLVQQGIVCIPKSTNPGRLSQNIDIFGFTLSDEDMDSLKKLDKGLEGRSFTARVFKGVVEHPEYPFNSY